MVVKFKILLVWLNNVNGVFFMYYVSVFWLNVFGKVDIEGFIVFI